MNSKKLTSVVIFYSVLQSCTTFQHGNHSWHAARRVDINIFSIHFYPAHILWQCLGKIGVRILKPADLLQGEFTAMMETHGQNLEWMWVFYDFHFRISRRTKVLLPVSLRYFFCFGWHFSSLWFLLAEKIYILRFTLYFN